MDATASMTLTWNPSANAAGYIIERETISDGTWTSYATVAGAMTTTYVDVRTNSFYTNPYNDILGYRYRVRATNSTATSATSNAYPVPRYAIIDLGTGINGTKITNSGYVLGVQEPSANAPCVWFKETTTTLQHKIPQQTDGL